ncbi:FIVAR domain-containing protein [Mycoplasmoides gallisepticum]|uniref:FIVAR domain-containing protein n=1 Tax=Mycoplasmoides gallisepticum TaxID=2096 RepID=UPI001248B3FB|nr:FIVAR domain-containing protein [Mycoplasmoides gallisepticum]QEX46130.1 hypothetical protein F6J65_03330 [Mycoplasmoides gallisepticum]
MKRKNILKFVSLLGIGSFVMLAAASCTSATTPTPNPPSGGMNGGDTNPGNDGEMDNSAQQFAAARTALTTLINYKTQNTELYVDYAKIQDTLVKAYDAAKAVLDNTASTTQNINQAKTKLEAAINDAAKVKTDFNAANGPLVTAYNALKETLKNEKSNLDLVMAAEFAAIKNNLDSLYQTAKTLVEGTLQSKMGNSPRVEAVSQANQAIVNATKMLETRKNNASTLNTSFLKETLKSASLSAATGDNATTVQQQQPGNYSFVAYASDIASPNWNFAQRTVWTADKQTRTSPLPNNSQNSAPLTDVSWIYTLSGTGAKYTLTFNWYAAAETGYLYFPYKLVKDSDKDKVALNYKLNYEMAKAVDFKTASSAPSVTPAPAVPSAAPAAKPAAEEEETAWESSTSKTMPAATTMNKAPTVADINVAKVKLTGLKFGENTIEFSVPSTTTDSMSKVAPMIGNMYLTSSNDEVNKNQIYDDLFGNSLATKNYAVTVHLLKGYSLATSWRTYIRQFTDLTDNRGQTSDPVYLIGLIGGSQDRILASANGPMNIQSSPNVDNDNRTFTIYVNAPEDAEYYISGAYLQGSNSPRSLKFSTGTSGSNNEVTVTNLKQSNWTTLGHFDTSMDSTTVNQSRRTLHLNKGLNKIILSGVSNQDTPFIGNLTFTLDTL